MTGPQMSDEFATALRNELVALVDSTAHERQRSPLLTTPTNVASPRRPVRGGGGHPNQWVAAAVALVLVGAVTGAVIAGSLSSAPPIAATPIPTPAADLAEVYTVSGVVIERDGVVQLCVGAVLQSRPPVCGGGVVLEGWDWDQAPVPSEIAGGVQFTEDAVTVQGTVRVGSNVGEAPTLTLTEPPGGATLDSSLADQMIPPSGLSSDQLQQIIDGGDLFETIGFAVAAVQDGYIYALVAFDDGTLQKAADDRFGPGVVHVDSALTPVGETR